MSEAPPKISCVMTAYNAAKYVVLAVESILNQTFRDFELIIIDDGSTDGTRAILERFAAADTRVRLTSRPNTGQVRAAIEGIAQARGQYLARMDADDISYPTRFAAQVAHLDAHTDCVLVGSWIKLVDPHGIEIGLCQWPTDHAAIDAELLAGRGGTVCQPVCMMRLSAYKTVGGYDTRFMSEDLDLFLKLAEVGQVANLPEVLLDYRRHLQSISHAKHHLQMETKQLMVGEAYSRRGLTPPKEWAFTTWHPAPPHEQLREWAWKALKVGRVEAARDYAKQLVKRKPFSVDSWRLMYCATRGH